MAKDKITEYDATANNNTVCGDVNIAENSALPSDMNNFAREIMSHLKEGLGSGTPLFVDQTNNRVGIGTSSPISALDLSGGADGTPQTITLAQGNASSKASSIVGSYSSTNEQGINFVTNNFGQSTAMSLTASGNLLVGTTSTADTDVGGKIFSDGRMVQGIADTGLADMHDFYRGTAGSLTRVGNIRTNGSSTTYNTSSDHRLKENVTADWDATTRLKQLNPVRFNFIADADTTVDGFLAHEVQSVVPEAITGTHNEVDADGNPVYQGIDQSKLVPLLVKTIQELEARITALETA